MTAEQIKSKIEFATTETADRIVCITGGIQFRAGMTYNAGLEAQHSRALEEIKERLKEIILRELYEDQRRELYEAVDGLIYGAPFGRSFTEAADRLMKAARYQRPAPEKTSRMVASIDEPTVTYPRDRVVACPTCETRVVVREVR